MQDKLCHIFHVYPCFTLPLYSADAYATSGQEDGEPSGKRTQYPPVQSKHYRRALPACIKRRGHVVYLSINTVAVNIFVRSSPSDR